MEFWEAIVLGIVQGLTEFLPVSSSGHLQIFNTLFGLQGEENLTFAVAVHAATVCSTIVVFRAELGRLIVGFFRFRRNAETVYVGKILLSMIPVAVVGLLFKEQVEALFASGLLVVGVSLILTAALLTFAYYARPRRRSDISFRDAFVIGIAQAFAAVLPLGLDDSNRTAAGRPQGGCRQVLVSDGADPDFGRGVSRCAERRFRSGRKRNLGGCADGRIHRRFRLGLSGLQLDDRSGQAREIDLFRRVLSGGGNRLDPLFSDLKR